jgi:thiol-disulfide isomerase/thioredoxin
MIRTLIVIAALAFAGQAGALNLKPVDAAPATPLNLTDLQGKQHTLDTYKGKVVLVQFWATYCTPCRKEMPSMNRLREKMGDDFVILAVNMGESRDDVEKFVSEVKPDFPILLDPDGGSIGAWQVFAAPSNFLLGPDGRVHYTLYGGVEWDSAELVRVLKQLAAAR